jgi:hypothetical protein
MMVNNYDNSNSVFSWRWRNIKDDSVVSMEVLYPHCILIKAVDRLAKVSDPRLFLCSIQ